MDPARPFTLRHRIRSFACALRGLRVMLRSQHNARIHAAATVIVVGLGLVARLTANEWCWIVVAIVMVWTAEALNTALELLCDVASPGFHPMVEEAKDVAAGAVLISAVGAAIIGAIIFRPHVLLMLPGAR